MSGPVRWRDDGRAPDEVRALLRSASRSRRLPSDVRARSASRLDRFAVLPAAAGVLFWLKGAAVAAGVVGAIVVVHSVPALFPATPPAPPLSSRVDRAAPRADAPSGVARAARSAEPPSPPPLPPPAAIPLPAPPPSRPSAKPAPSAPRPASAPETSSLAREAALLERARASLARAPAVALADLGAHARDFPDGALRLERELLAVDALRRLGRAPEARARGEALLVNAGGTIYEGRIRSLLRAQPTAAP